MTKQNAMLRLLDILQAMVRTQDKAIDRIIALEKRVSKLEGP